MSGKREKPVEPVPKRWANAPRDSCEHDRVVMLSDEAEGKVCLWCSKCDESWWEDPSNVKPC